MDSGQSSLFQVSVDFGTSHMFFPKIVIAFLLFLLVLIFVIYGIPKIKRLMSGEQKLNFSSQHMDKLRFFGTIALTVAYFLSMNYVGEFFPNEGLGFLFMSIPFIFLLSLLYSHGVNKRKFIIIVLNAVLAPSIAWYVLANMFNISLP